MPHPSLTDLQRAILDYCEDIPEDETVPYPEAAVEFGVTAGAMRMHAKRLARRGHQEARRLIPADTSTSLTVAGIKAWHFKTDPPEDIEAEYHERRDKVRLARAIKGSPSLAMDGEADLNRRRYRVLIPRS